MQTQIEQIVTRETSSDVNSSVKSKTLEDKSRIIDDKYLEELKLELERAESERYKNNPSLANKEAFYKMAKQAFQVPLAVTKNIYSFFEFFHFYPTSTRKEIESGEIRIIEHGSSKESKNEYYLSDIIGASFGMGLAYSIFFGSITAGVNYYFNKNANYCLIPAGLFLATNTLSLCYEGVRKWFLNTREEILKEKIKDFKK